MRKVSLLSPFTDEQKWETEKLTCPKLSTYYVNYAIL